MLLSKKKSVLLMAIVLSLLFLITGCDKGNEFANEKPTIKITSFNGYYQDDVDAITIDTLLTNSIEFFQKIEWVGKDTDGIITGYAYRIKDSEGNYCRTYGHNYIDENGWIYHYKVGQNHDISLENPSVRTIWTDVPNVVVYFPAADSLGISTNVTSVFELKCIDDSGEESEIEQRYFFSKTDTPQTLITTSSGDINGEQIGTGIRLQFGMNDGDHYSTAAIPATKYDYFEYQLFKRNAMSKVIIDGEYDAEWNNFYSTLDSYAKNEVLLTAQPDPENKRPYLKVDSFDGADEAVTETVLIARGYDIAGCVSEPDTVVCYVKDSFYPGTMIYGGTDIAMQNNAIFVLGRHNYIDNVDAKTPGEIPSRDLYNKTIFSNPFFFNLEGMRSAVWSSDLQIFMKWGWHGEYGTQETLSGGGVKTVVTDNPTNKKLNMVVYEPTTSQTYFSEIHYFDIRLDGEPFYYPTYSNDPNYAEKYLFVDENGTEWLRVGRSDVIFQEAVLTNLSAGRHLFELRAVDMQGAVDKSPEKFVFDLVAPPTYEEKDGILIIADNFTEAGSYYKKDIAEDFYKNLFPETYNVDFINRNDLTDTDWYSSTYHFGDKDALCPTDLLKYELVILYADNPSSETNLNLEYNVLNIYSELGGNLIIVTAPKTIVTKTLPMSRQGSYRFFEELFDIEVLNLETDVFSALSMDFNMMNGGEAKPYFIGANPLFDIYPEISFADTSQLNLISPTIGAQGGLGIIMTIDPLSLGDSVPIYTAISREAGSGEFEPSQIEKTELEQGFVGVKYTRTNDFSGKTQNNYLLTFPLMYMDREQAKEFMTSVLEDNAISTN